MKTAGRACVLVLLLALVSGCAAREHQEWVNSIFSKHQAWSDCAMNATKALSRQYSDPEMVARYALHLCEKQKFAWQNAYLTNRAYVGKAQETFVRVEDDLRLKLQMFATKSMADQDAEWAQAFPEPLVFR